MSSETRDHFIGIDFGTSKCVTTVYNPRSRTSQVVRNAEREERTPSAVLYHSDGRILVGRAALTECEINEEERPNLVLSCKRFIADDDYQYDVPGDPTARQAATQIFRKLHRDLAHEFGFPPTRAVVTVPAIFTPVQRLAVREAAQAGGFEQVELLEEPVAAAITYSEQGFNPGERFLIYDLGAGTFDLALLRLVEVRPDGKPVYEQALPPMGLRFGGDDIDETVYRLLDRKCRESHHAPLAGDGRQKTHLLFRCRLQKELLSGGTVTPFSYLSPTLKQRVEFIITRDEFDILVAEQILRTVEPVRHMIETARRKLGLRDKGAVFPLDDLVLVGGSTELRQIPELLEAELNAPLKHVREWGNRDVAVALGAGYQAFRLWGSPRSTAPSLLSTLEAIREKGTGFPEPRPVTFPETPAPTNPWDAVSVVPPSTVPPGISASDFSVSGKESLSLPETAIIETPTIAMFERNDMPVLEEPVQHTALQERPTEDETLKRAPTAMDMGPSVVEQSHVEQPPVEQPQVEPPTIAEQIPPFDQWPGEQISAAEAVPAETSAEEQRPAEEQIPEEPAVDLVRTPTLPAPFPGAPPIVAARLAVVVPPISEEMLRTPGAPVRVALFLRASNGTAEPTEIGQGFLSRGVESTVNVRLGRCTVYTQLDDGMPAQEFSLDCAFTSVYTLYLRYDPHRRRFSHTAEPGPALTETKLTEPKAREF